MSLSGPQEHLFKFIFRITYQQAGDNMKKSIVFGLLLLAILMNGCSGQAKPGVSATDNSTQGPGPSSPIGMKEAPKELPKGVLVSSIPDDTDIIFTSIRYVLNDTACLDENYELKANFINDPECNRKIYASDGQLSPPSQLFAMDVESGDVEQITNLDCLFVSGQAMDSKTMMAIAVCSDTDGNGRINQKDRPQLYTLDLGDGEMDCLTCDTEYININNPDYSPAAGKVVFSAATGQGMNNHLYAIGPEKDPVQLTNDSDFLDFDCSWSDEGSKIVFSRLPSQQYPYSIPSQVWLMDADGSNLKKITNGGKNPAGEENQGPYPIGIDADPDLSPDGDEIVFSRLKTGKENLFGIYELAIVDVDGNNERILDSQYANMVPEWKEGGILFLRQIGTNTSNAMDIRQSVYLYKDGKFEDLESYPYNVFPLGAYSASWVER